jgi:hypothetical protein
MVAAALRLVGLGHESFWFDEVWSVLQVQLGASELLASLATSDVHPPLYSLLLWLWVRLGDSSEAWVRGLSVLPSVASVLVAAALGARLALCPAARHRGALWAAGFVATSGHLVEFAQETRSYSWLLFFTLLATLALARWMESPRHRGRMLAYCGAAALLAYTHVYGLFALVGQAAFWLRYRPLPARRALLSAAAVAIAFLPWIPVLLQQTERVQSGFWIPPLSWADLFRFPWAWAGYNPVALVAVPVLVGLALARRHALPASTRLVSSLIAWTAAAPVLLGVAASLVAQPIFYAKYAIGAVGLWLVLAGAGANAQLWKGRAEAVLAVVLAIGLTAGVIWNVHRPIHKEQWRELCAFAAERSAQGAALVAEPETARYLPLYLERYHPAPQAIAADSAEAAWREAERVGAAELCVLAVHPADPALLAELSHDHREVSRREFVGAAARCFVR